MESSLDLMKMKMNRQKEAESNLFLDLIQLLSFLLANLSLRIL